MSKTVVRDFVEETNEMRSISNAFIERGIQNESSIILFEGLNGGSGASSPYLEFKFGINEDVTETLWIQETRLYVITKGMNHRSDIQRDIQIDTSTNKYIAKCPVAEPIVTDDVDELVDHIISQKRTVEDAIRFNAEVERFTDALIHPSTTDNELRRGRTDSQRSPARLVRGIGDTQVRVLARELGTYYNLANAEPISVPHFTNWHHLEQQDIIDKCEKTIELYYDYVENPFDGERWSEFPKKTVFEKEYFRELEKHFQRTERD